LAGDTGGRRGHDGGGAGPLAAQERGAGRPGGGVPAAGTGENDEGAPPQEEGGAEGGWGGFGGAGLRGPRAREPARACCEARGGGGGGGAAHGRAGYPWGGRGPAGPTAVSPGRASVPRGRAWASPGWSRNRRRGRRP